MATHFHHRSDALQGMLVLAAATQHAEGSREAGALQQAQEAMAAAAAAGAPEHHPPRGRQESVSSDYSEGQQYNAAMRAAQRGGAANHESEEEKREKRCADSPVPGLHTTWDPIHAHSTTIAGLRTSDVAIHLVQQ